MMFLMIVVIVVVIVIMVAMMLFDDWHIFFGWIVQWFVYLDWGVLFDFDGHVVRDRHFHYRKRIFYGCFRIPFGKTRQYCFGLDSNYLDMGHVSQLERGSIGEKSQIKIGDFPYFCWVSGNQTYVFFDWIRHIMWNLDFIRNWIVDGVWYGLVNWKKNGELWFIISTIP